MTLKENDNPFAILFNLIFTGIGSLYTYERQALFGLILQALLVTFTFVVFAKANLPKYGIFSLRFQHPFLIASSRGPRNYFNLHFYHSINQNFKIVLLYWSTFKFSLIFTHWCYEKNRLLKLAPFYWTFPTNCFNFLQLGFTWFIIPAVMEFVKPCF